MQISVVIPLYNKKGSILQALDSVFNQSFQPLEVLVVNDGSNDGSEKVVEDLNHPLVHLIHQSNAGVSAARNTGIEKATGEWIAFLDADDKWKPEYLETIKFLSKTYPKCKVLATAYVLEDHKGNQTQITLNRIPFFGFHGELSNYFEVASYSHPPLWSSAITINTKALKKIEGFPKGIASGEDLLTWAYLAVDYNIAYHLNPLSTYFLDRSYTYEGAPTRNPQIPDLVGSELIRLSRKFPEILYLKRYVAHWLIMRSSIYLRLGKSKESLVESIKSLKFNLFNFKAYFFMLLALVPVNKNKVFKFLKH